LTRYIVVMIEFDKMFG